MKVVALLSGGKNSCFNMMRCVQEGHQVVCTANLFKLADNELDSSYKCRSLGSEGIKLYEEALELPMFRHEVTEKVSSSAECAQEESDKMGDLYQLLKRVKEWDPDIKGVSMGLITKAQQKRSLEDVCNRLALTPLCYLWELNGLKLLDEMIAAGVKAVLIKVTEIGLQQHHLGQTLEQMRPHLSAMCEKHDGLHACGEGGEYETFVLDCPMFKRKCIRVDGTETVLHVDDPLAPVAYLKLTKLTLVDKQQQEVSSSDRQRQQLALERKQKREQGLSKWANMLAGVKARHLEKEQEKIRLADATAEALIREEDDRKKAEAKKLMKEKEKAKAENDRRLANLFEQKQEKSRLAEAEARIREDERKAAEAANLQKGQKKAKKTKQKPEVATTKRNVPKVLRNKKWNAKSKWRNQNEDDEANEDDKENFGSETQNNRKNGFNSSDGSNRSAKSDCSKCDGLQLDLIGLRKEMDDMKKDFAEMNKHIKKQDERIEALEVFCGATKFRNTVEKMINKEEQKVEQFGMTDKVEQLKRALNKIVHQTFPNQKDTLKFYNNDFADHRDAIKFVCDSKGLPYEFIDAPQ